jgi:ribose/xylose/arabinose/galactoside ABC-type transport system permease subunit
VEEKVTAKRQPIQMGRLIKDNNSILILVILLFIAFAFVDGFANGFYNVFLYSAQFGVCCLGLGLVMITGNIDLSVGYIAATSGVALVSCFNLIYSTTGNALLSTILGLVAALITGGVCGLFNGFVITKIGVSPLIATIATNYIYQGIVFNFAKTTYAPAEKSVIQSVAKTRIFGLKWLTPMVILFVVVVALIFFWMYKTGYGNRLHIVGDNPEAAQYAGISVTNTVWVTYIICGLLAGLTGFLLVSFNGAAIYTQGSSLGTFPISCCVIGGIKMSGGKGTAVHILLGVMIMRVISAILSALYLPTAYVNLATGVLLVAVLLLDRFTSTKKEED